MLILLGQGYRAFCFCISLLRERKFKSDLELSLHRSVVEMGRSSADAKVRPKTSAECSARFGSATCDHSAEVQSNFGKHSASFVASHLRRFALAADDN